MNKHPNPQRRFKMAELNDPAVTNILEPEDQPADDSGVDEAMDIADEHPEAKVLGVDLSLIQPGMNLMPGGYIEVQDNIYPLASDDGIIHNTDILTWSELIVNAANKISRSITVASEFKSMLADAGFIDIVEIKKKIPIGNYYTGVTEWLHRRHSYTGVIFTASDWSIPLS
ncbi:hypothetical protein ACKAV7_013091 [Fusarium commune]